MADALDSGSSARKGMWVQVPSSAVKGISYEIPFFVTYIILLYH